jgi:hypothetical protein
VTVAIAPGQVVRPASVGSVTPLDGVRHRARVLPDEQRHEVVLDLQVVLLEVGQLGRRRGALGRAQDELVGQRLRRLPRGRDLVEERPVELRRLVRLRSPPSGATPRWFASETCLPMFGIVFP